MSSSENSKLSICGPRHTGCFIDWMSLTFPPEFNTETLEQFLQGLVFPGELVRAQGSKGYNSAIRNCDRSIELLLNGGHKGMGPHLQLTGKACVELQDELLTLAKWALAKGAKGARVDLTIDEPAGLLDLDEIQKALTKGCCVSKFRKPPRVEELYHPQTGEVVGKIIRFGSRTSKVSIRFYDKSKQLGEEYHWLRVELELKKEIAQQILEDWHSGTTLNELFFGILSSYLSFRDPADDRNRSRWPITPWWQLFLDQGPKEIFRIRRDPPKEEDLEWFVERYDKVVARAERYYGPDIFQRMIESGRQKLLSG